MVLRCNVDVAWFIDIDKYDGVRKRFATLCLVKALFARLSMGLFVEGGNKYSLHDYQVLYQRSAR